MGEAKKNAADVGTLYLKSKEKVTEMDKEVQEFKDKLRKKGKAVSEAKKALNEKCIEECSTGLYQSLLLVYIIIIYVVPNILHRTLSHYTYNQCHKFNHN